MPAAAVIRKVRALSGFIGFKGSVGRRKIALAMKIARHTIHVAHENVVFAIGVKVAVLILATVGLGTMWMAVFADVGVNNTTLKVLAR